jgi:DNA-binding NarL/FixJ family response regulator
LRSLLTPEFDVVGTVGDGRELVVQTAALQPDVAVFYAHREGKVQQPNSLDLLTPRQREILQLLAEGATAKEVATQLQISPRTVEYHTYRVMPLLGLQTNADIVQYAIKAGLVVM